jgi:hypothetical protein
MAQRIRVVAARIGVAAMKVTTQARRMFTVAAIARAQSTIAEALLPTPLSRIVGRVRIYLIFPTAASVVAPSFHDPVDGEPLIECHRFTTESDARQWCDEQEVQ